MAIMIGVSVDSFFYTNDAWWMASSLPMNSILPELLGSCILADGTIYGGRAASAFNIPQRPAL